LRVAGEPFVGVVAPVDVCPATGDTAISKASAPESQRTGRGDRRGAEFGEFSTLMLTMYAENASREQM